MSLPNLAPRATALLLALAAALGLAAPAAPAAAQAAPSLAYGTFLGGAGDDGAKAVAVDAAGNIYVAGSTYSQPFPGASGEGRDTDAFVVKLDPSGRTVLYSALIGGSDDEEGLALAVDAQGNAWVAGLTQSADLPLTKPLRATPSGDNDAFVAKLGPAGQPLLVSYLGEIGADQASAIALDAQGNAYLAGFASASFGPEVMVKKIKADGSAVAYNAFFGRASRGFARGSRATGVAVDAQGNAHVVGVTNTGAMDTDGLQDQCAGYENAIDDCPSDDAFLMVLNPTGTGFVGGTALGGLGGDSATGVALDGQGNIYVAGTTFSGDFPTKAAAQPERAGPDNFADAFLVKLAPLAQSIVYSTYYGGEAYDEAAGVAVDAAGRAHLTGLTSSADLAVPGAVQPAIAGLCVTGSTTRRCYDAFVASFAPAGALGWATYLGGTDDDLGAGVAVGPDGDVFAAGRADSSALPTTAGALQAQRRGGDDAFLMRLSTRAAPAGVRVFLPLTRR